VGARSRGTARGGKVASRRGAMAGKSAAAEKGRAKLEAFKAARLKKAHVETVPIPEPKPNPAEVPEPTPGDVAAPTKPEGKEDGIVTPRDVPTTPSVSDPSPAAPRARPEDPSVPKVVPGDVPAARASARSLSSAYAALSDEYLPPRRPVPVEPREAPESFARDAGNAAEPVHAHPPNPPSRISDDLEPPPFISPFNSRPTRPPNARDPREPEPFAPVLTSTPVLGFADAHLPRRRSAVEDAESPDLPSSFFSARAAEASEVEALQRVVDDVTRERMAFQRGLEKQQELTRVLAEENDALTSRLNELAEESDRLRDANARALAAVRVRDDALGLAIEERDDARAAALDAHDRASRSAVETVELEEKLRSAKDEIIRMRRDAAAEAERRDRCERAHAAAAADRDDMANAIEGFRREREFLRAKLRDVAAREERDMERRFTGRGDADEDEDEEDRAAESNASERFAESAIRNTDSRSESDTRAHAARLFSALEEAADERARGGGGSPSREDDCSPSGAVGGVFRFASRSANGDFAKIARDVGEDQLRVVDSIHQLLSEVEAERTRAKRALAEARARIATLEATNSALERRLAGKREMEATGGETETETEMKTETKTKSARREPFNEKEQGDDDDDVSSCSFTETVGNDDEDHDEDAWSDDEISQKRGFFSFLNPFAKRRERRDAF